MVVKHVVTNSKLKLFLKNTFRWQIACKKHTQYHVKTKDELSDQEELKKHIQHIHTFACETCDKSGYGQTMGQILKLTKTNPRKKKLFL